MKRASTCLLMLIPVALAQSAENRTGPDAVMQQALHYADLYNWSDAGPLFQRAETQYHARRDRRNELYAHLGVIRSTMESRSLPRTSAELRRELQVNPFLQDDLRLRMFALSVKGDIDGEIDAGPMNRDWEQVRSLSERLKDRKWTNRAIGELGFAEFMEGNMDDARKHVGAALIWAASNRDAGAQIRFLSGIGTGLSLVHNNTGALTYIDKALALAASTPDAGYPFFAKEGKVQALFGLGKLDEAGALASEIISEARRRNKLVKEAQARITKSRINLAADNSGAALQELQAAASIAQMGGFLRLLADTQMAEANIYADRHDLRNAELLASEAIAATQKNAEPYLLPQRFAALAELQVKEGRYADAERSYEKAGFVLDGIVGSVSNLATKSSLIETMSEMYVGQFSLLVDHLHQPDRALAEVESARGRAIRDLLLQGRLNRSTQADAVEERIADLRLKLASTSNSSRARSLRDQLFLAEQERWVVDNNAVVRAGALRGLNLKEIQARLAANEIVLEYVLGDPRSYCIAMTRTSMRVTPLLPRKDLEGDIDQYVQRVHSQSAAVAEGKKLYSDLLAPISEINRYAHLIVVPDGKLFLVPLDALVDRSGSYVLEKDVVSYAPSASALALMRSSNARTSDPHGSLLAVGGVPYRGKGTLAKIALESNAIDQLPNLPGSKEEIAAATAAFPSNANTLLTDGGASESALKEADLQHRSVMHLAVHAIADQVHPDRAALILLSDPKSSEDGLLESSEIAHMRLNAELVVLSACDTAAGRLQGEEGIANLSRAFLIAGAHSVVSTLWSVDDTFSVYMMRRFYEHLSGGETVETALRDAKLDAIHRFGSHAIPYLWAGYVVDGLADRQIKSSEHKLYASK